MQIVDLFSTRQAREAGVDPPLPQTTTLSHKFRVQFAHILTDTIPGWDTSGRDWAFAPQNKVWAVLLKTLTENHGVAYLAAPNLNPQQDCLGFLFTQTDPAKVLDLIEISLRYIDAASRGPNLAQRLYERGLSTEAVKAVDTFNHRCRENGVGYQFERGRLVPSASEMIHDEVVRPALKLLYDEGFRGPEEELMKAFAELRRGNYAGATVEAGKAFESMMKTVCRVRGYPEDVAKFPAQKLINTLITNGFFPPSMQNQLTALRMLLESGVPTLRNDKGAAHGAGEHPVEVPRELAEYAIHLTASNIVLLGKLLAK